MRFLAVLALATVLVACTGNQDTGWKDVSGAKREQAALDADMAGCQYDMAKSQSAQPVQPNYTAGAAGGGYIGQGFNNLGTAMSQAGPGPRVLQACMASRGWKQMY